MVNTVHFRGIQKISGATVTKFPTIEDMAISAKDLIDELQKMIDEQGDDTEGQSVHFGLKVAISAAKRLQEAAYQDFLAACKLSQV